MKSKLSTSKDSDLAKWCAALASSAALDAVPPGWLTARQLAAKLGKSRNTMGSLLASAVREGRADRQDFRIVNGQVTRPVPHYKLR